MSPTYEGEGCSCYIVSQVPDKSKSYVEVVQVDGEGESRRLVGQFDFVSFENVARYLASRGHVLGKVIDEEPKVEVVSPDWL